MSSFVEGTGLSEVWLRAVEHLAQQRGHEEFNLVVVVNPGDEIPAVRQVLNLCLERHGLQTVETVANTLFPWALFLMSQDRHELYQRYERLVPTLRRFWRNNRGTYFERIISWNGEWGKKMNQLEAVVGKLKRPTSDKCVYEISIYDPRADSRLSHMMRFPCLSHISFKLDRHSGLLHAVALYRNHYYFQRAYGNLVGLSAMQNFIAKEAKLRVGELVCHSTHAEIDALSKREIGELTERCRKALNEVVRSNA